MLLFKECGFPCHRGFSFGARISWTRCLAAVWEVWHRHSWFCRQSNAFVLLGHQEIYYKYSNTLKQRLRQNQEFGRLASKSMDQCRERLDQVKNILTAVKGGVLSGVPLINDENFYVCISGRKWGNNGIILNKIIFDNKKGWWKWCLWYMPVKVHNVDIDWLAFGEKKKVNLSILNYFMLHLMIGEND